MWMLASLRRRRERNLVYDATSTEAVVVRPLNGTIAADTRVSETNKEPPTADMPVVRKKQSVKGAMLFWDGWLFKRRVYFATNTQFATFCWIRP